MRAWCVRVACVACVVRACCVRVAFVLRACLRACRVVIARGTHGSDIWYCDAVTFFST